MLMCYVQKKLNSSFVKVWERERRRNEKSYEFLTWKARWKVTNDLLPTAGFLEESESKKKIFLDN